MKHDFNRFKKALDETVLKDIDVTEEEKRKLLRNLDAPEKTKRKYKKYYAGFSAAALLLLALVLPFLIDFNGGMDMMNSSQESSTSGESGDSSASRTEDKQAGSTEENGHQEANLDRAENKESSAGWAYRFVQWNGQVYVITETTIPEERIGEEIGEVTAHSTQETSSYSGNFSNAFEKGTPFYQIKDMETSEEIAVKTGEGEFVKAVVREKWMEKNSN